MDFRDESVLLLRVRVDTIRCELPSPRVATHFVFVVVFFAPKRLSSCGERKEGDEPLHSSLLLSP